MGYSSINKIATTVTATKTDDNSQISQSINNIAFPPDGLTYTNNNELIDLAQRKGITKNGDNFTASFSYKQYLKDDNGNILLDDQGSQILALDLDIKQYAVRKIDHDNGKSGYTVSFDIENKAPAEYTLQDGSQIKINVEADFLYEMDTALGVNTYYSESYFLDNKKVEKAQFFDKSVTGTTMPASYTTWSPELVDLGVSERIDVGNCGGDEPDYVAIGNYYDIAGWEHYKGGYTTTSSTPLVQTTHDWGSTMVWNNRDLSGSKKLEIRDIGFNVFAIAKDNNLNGITNITIKKPVDIFSKETTGFKVPTDFGDDTFFYIKLCDATANNLALKEISVRNSNNITKSFNIVKEAQKNISEFRSNFGVGANRTSAVKYKNLNVHENLQAAESRIRDADMANMMSELNKSQILEKASLTIMAQSNTLPENILQLLQQ